jgi:steroid delta-isomerase-like uncharacterized protein
MRLGHLRRHQPIARDEEDITMALDNKAIVRRLYEDVWNDRKLNLIDKLFAPSHALDEPTTSGSQMGPAAYKEQVNRFVAAFPDLHLEIDDLIGEKDKVVLSWVISGTHTGDFMGIPATNKKVSFEGITIIQIAGGKILDSSVRWDALGLMRQLGAVPSLAQTSPVQQSKATASHR